MKATSKQEFFELLEYELKRLGIEDTENIFADFEEHFADGAMLGVPESVTADELGDIKEIARSYLNLESSRLNSIMARDIERTKISLTKEGHSVPADLSLVKEQPQDIQDVLNSDNIRSITPEHLTSEVYPQSVPTNSQSVDGAAGSNGIFDGAANAQYAGGSFGTEQNNSQSSSQNASQSSTEKTVGAAFSEAGKAAAEAAKVTGHAIAEAFSSGKVKTAVTEAGKSAAEAVKTASKSAADAINKAKADHERKHAQHSDNSACADEPVSDAAASDECSSAQYSDKFSEEQNQSAQNVNLKKKKSKEHKQFSEISDFKGMKANVDGGRLAAAIVLDIFLWSWLLPTIVSCVISLFCLGVKIMGESFSDAFASPYHWISGLFLFVALLSLGAIIIVFSVFLVKKVWQLVKYVIITHYKAVYNV